MKPIVRPTGIYLGSRKRMLVWTPRHDGAAKDSDWFRPRSRPARVRQQACGAALAENILRASLHASSQRRAAAETIPSFGFHPGPDRQGRAVGIPHCRELPDALPQRLRRVAEIRCNVVE